MFAIDPGWATLISGLSLGGSGLSLYLGHRDRSFARRIKGLELRVALLKEFSDAAIESSKLDLRLADLHWKIKDQPRHKEFAERLVAPMKEVAGFRAKFRHMYDAIESAGLDRAVDLYQQAFHTVQAARDLIKNVDRMVGEALEEPADKSDKARDPGAPRHLGDG